MPCPTVNLSVVSITFTILVCDFIVYLTIHTETIFNAQHLDWDITNSIPTVPTREHTVKANSVKPQDISERIINYVDCILTLSLELLNCNTLPNQLSRYEQSKLILGKYNTTVYIIDYR